MYYIEIMVGSKLFVVVDDGDNPPDVQYWKEKFQDAHPGTSVYIKDVWAYPGVGGILIVSGKTVITTTMSPEDLEGMLE